MNDDGQFRIKPWEVGLSVILAVLVVGVIILALSSGGAHI